MVIAALAAIAVTILGLVPFWVAIKRIRLIDPSMPLALLGPFLLTTVVSLLILVAGIAACKLIAPYCIVVYSLTELIAFTVGVVVMGVLAKQRVK